MGNEAFEKQPEIAIATDPQPPQVDDDRFLSAYSKPMFQERLGRMRDKTGFYIGNLITARETFRDITPADGQVQPLDVLPDLTPAARQQIGLLTSRIQNSRAETVVMEAGHSYMYHDLGDPDFRDSIVLQSVHAAELTKRLEESGIKVNQTIFIDDYNPNPETGRKEENLDIDGLVELMNSAGFFPTTKIFEGSMEDLALSMIRYMGAHQDLIKLGAAEENGSQGILLKRKGYELYKTKSDMVSCAMLDAALTIAKLTYLGEGVVNILPRNSGSENGSYRSQQKKMRTIAGEHLSTNVLPVYNLFTGTEADEKIAAGAHHALRKPR